MDPLTLAGELDSLEPIRRYVDAATAEAGLEKGPAYKLALAIDELATNAIVHGYQENSLTGDITVRAELTPEKLSLCLEDTAPAFDPTSAAQPGALHLDEPLVDRPIGGLGIFLVVQDIDSFTYQREGDRNITILAMNRT